MARHRAGDAISIPKFSVTAAVTAPRLLAGPIGLLMIWHGASKPLNFRTFELLGSPGTVRKL
eukprot:763858-Hanusia_phi.AAC.6